ncbi:MAG: metallophosphoesterase [Fidelibacterota bacterium]|nr:MAG: metallophosphoesterase [Candidatus Neomarinimicrobiota bacterium]
MNNSIARILRNSLWIGLFVAGTVSCTREIESEAFLNGPYLQNVQQNSMTIMWETSEPGIGKVEYWNSTTEKQVVEESDPSTIHEIVLSDLATETEYWYRILTDEGASRRYRFQTAVREETPFAFAVYGDNRNGPLNHKRITDIIASKEPNFVIHGGDLVNRGRVYVQWNKLFFGPAASMMSQIPLFPVLGNHEDHSEHYYNYFSLPGNEQWYSFDFGNTHFVFLDSDDDFLEEGDQMEWLIEDLEKNTAEWTIAIFHHPPFTSGGNYYRPDRIYRKNLLHPIMEKYGVDIVFNGHDHHYERIKPVKTRKGDQAVTYVVAGNGGIPMRFSRTLEWTASIGRIFGFVQVSVNGSKLTYQAINIDDEVFDELTLDKSDPEMMAEYYAGAIIFEDIVDKLDVSRLEREADNLMDDGMYVEAIAIARKAVALDPSCVEAWAIMAISSFEAGEYEEAKAAAERAISVLPAHPDAYEVLAEYYVQKGDFPAALEYCEQLVQVEPDKPGGYEEMADVWLAKGDTMQAIGALESALEVLPSESDIYFEIAGLYERTGSPGKAFDAYQNGLYWFTEEFENDDVETARKYIAEHQK